MQQPPQQQQQHHLPQPPPQQQNLQIHHHAPEAFRPPRGHVPMINKAYPSKREMKKFTREVNLAEACMATEYVDWSEQPIHFCRDDLSPSVPRPGHAALVVEAQIVGFNMGKVLMDGGSDLNLLFASTLKVMGIPPEALAERLSQFHGVIPTLPAEPLGKISLEVILGKPGNFRKERLEFEVVDIESQYHAIHGRPAFAKFMAVPHYTYLKMKMPGNNGTPQTVHGSFLRSDNCDRDFQRMCQHFGHQDEHKAQAALVDHSQPPEDGRPSTAEEFSPAQQTHAKQVHPTDQSKTVNISKNLTEA